MAFYADRVKETTATTGTGTFTLAGAVIGFQSFAAGFPSASTVVYYCATDGTNWEVGQGTYTLSGTTLSRTTVLASSNAGSLVSFPGPSTQVFCTAPAADINRWGQPGTTIAAGTTQTSGPARQAVTVVYADASGALSTLFMPGPPLDGDVYILKTIGATFANAPLIKDGNSNTIEDPNNPGNFTAGATGVNTTAFGTFGVAGLIFIWQYQAASTRWVLLQGIYPNYLPTTFTASGSWTAPPGVSAILIQGQGGGGQGGGGAGGIANSAVSQPGGGGGAGAIPVIQTVKVTPGTTYTITIGAGGSGAGAGGAAGAAGTSGGAGAATTFANGGSILYSAPGAAGGEGGGIPPAGISAGGGIPAGGVNRIGGANPSWVDLGYGGWGGASAGASATPTSGAPGQANELTFNGPLGTGGVAGVVGATGGGNAGGCGGGGGGAGVGCPSTISSKNGTAGRNGGAGQAAATGSVGSNSQPAQANSGAGSGGASAGGNGTAGGAGGTAGAGGSGQLTIFYIGFTGV